MPPCDSRSPPSDGEASAQIPATEAGDGTITAGALSVWRARLKLPSAIVGVNLLVLFAARVTLLKVFSDDFAHKSGPEVAGAFWRGLRFDLSAVMTVYGLPLLMLALPGRFAAGAVWQGIWKWICFALSLVTLLLVVADLVYFDFVHRHVGPEIVTLLEEAQDLAALAFSEHAIALAGVVGAFVVLGLGWKRFPRRGPETARAAGRSGEVAFTVVVTLLIFSGARGSLSGSPLSLGDAFESDGPVGAHLSVNAPSSVLHALFWTARTSGKGVPWEGAVAVTREMVRGPGESFVDPDRYPVLRFREATTAGPRPNVVVILLEGWSLTAVDCYREDLGLDPLGATPNFDRLAKEGLRLRRFHACGQRTRSAMAGVLVGFPTIPGSPYFGHGLEQRGLSYLPRIAKSNGYETSFVMGIERLAQHRQSYLMLAGIDTVVGTEDMPVGKLKTTRRRALDGMTFNQAHKVFDRAQEPFLGIVHTDSTHEPYLWSKQEGFKRFASQTRFDNYHTAVAYADLMLGRFFEKARKADYFDRTIFFLVSDHIQRKPPGNPALPALFQVPGLILAPGLDGGESDVVCSQVDILPTLIDLADWEASYAAFGRSVLAPEPLPERGVLCGIPGLQVWIERDGWIAHNGRKVVASGSTGEDFDLDACRERMLSFLTVTRRALLDDRIAPLRE